MNRVKMHRSMVSVNWKSKNFMYQDLSITLDKSAPPGFPGGVFL
jgi:hypothetical protein